MKQNHSYKKLIHIHLNQIFFFIQIVTQVLSIETTGIILDPRLNK